MSPVNVGSIGGYIRQQREQAKISLRQLAAVAGISNPYLSQIERGLRRPSAEILQQIARGLRISAEALYVQAGILEDRRPDSGVRAAVLADPELAERQKQVLLDIYESFRREPAAGPATGPGTGEPAEGQAPVGPPEAPPDGPRDQAPGAFEASAGQAGDQAPAGTAALADGTGPSGGSAAPGEGAPG